MRVITRYKDNAGKIYAYDIKDKSQTKRVSTVDVIKLKDKITNATLLKNGEYRANKESSIETKVEQLHKYIDISKLRDFSEKKDFDSIMNDIVNKYKITNIAEDDEESLVYLTEALLNDYENEITNYESYIEVGMDARLMMELRKNACLKMAPKLEYFYAEHHNLNTVKEVADYRTKFLQSLNKEIIGLDWEYWIIVRRCWGRKAKDFIVDYESCFADGDWRKEHTVEEYKQQFLENYKWAGKMYD